MNGRPPGSYNPYPGNYNPNPGNCHSSPVSYPVNPQPVYQPTPYYQQGGYVSTPAACPQPGFSCNHGMFAPTCHNHFHGHHHGHDSHHHAFDHHHGHHHGFK